MTEAQAIEAIRAVTRANERLIRDTYGTYKKGITPLPGTMGHMVYLCWRMAEQLGYEPEED